MVNFEQAVIMLRRGKKITRDSWNKDSYWQLDKKGIIHWTDNTPALINANQVLKVTDFKEWKEPKESKGVFEDSCYKITVTSENELDVENKLIGRRFVFHDSLLLLKKVMKYMEKDIKKSELKEPKELTFAEEINKHPDRFQYLTKDGWINVSFTDGLSSSETAKILNSKWNHNDMNDNVFYVEFLSCDLTYKEIVRRKE